MGIKATQVTFTRPTLAALINGYAREAGVRSLENQIKKILRKVAVKLVRGGKGRKVSLTLANLEKFVGKPLFTEDRLYEETPVGVAAGLAWTSMGGVTLYVEAIKVPADKIEMKLTGQAGEVMKESCAIAWTYLHGAVHDYAKGRNFFKKSSVHLHIPEGATPKDGPSAGITMVTAMLSLLLNKPVHPNLCMTGELTLTGRVLPVGGIKEKLIAARRAGLQHVIFPKDNERDCDELPDYLKEDIKIHFVEHYDDVYQLAFKQKNL